MCHYSSGFYATSKISCFSLSVAEEDVFLLQQKTDDTGEASNKFCSSSRSEKCNNFCAQSHERSDVDSVIVKGDNFFHTLYKCIFCPLCIHLIFLQIISFILLHGPQNNNSNCLSYFYHHAYTHMKRKFPTVCLVF